MQALVEGVIAAKKETQERNLPVKIGFDFVPESPARILNFRENLYKTGGRHLLILWILSGIIFMWMYLKINRSS